MEPGHGSSDPPISGDPPQPGAHPQQATPPVPPVDVSALFRHAIQLAEANRYDEAHAAFRQIVQNDPDNEMAWMWLASVSGTVEERRHALREVIRINPSNQQAHQMLMQLQTPAGAHSGIETMVPRRKPVVQYDQPPSAGVHLVGCGMLGVFLVGLSFVVGGITESVTVFCLVHTLLPIFIGLLGAIAGVSRRTVNTLGRGAVEGGTTSAITAGLISALMGLLVMTVYSSLFEEFQLAGELGIMSFTDIGAGFLVFVVVFLAIYFLFGLIGGVVAAAVSGKS